MSIWNRFRRHYHLAAVTSNDASMMSRRRQPSDTPVSLLVEPPPESYRRPRPYQGMTPSATLAGVFTA
jgi:hypothetical protein